MANNGHILLFLGVPPPWGGGELRGREVAGFLSGRPGFRVKTFSRKTASKGTQGRATIGNVAFGSWYVGWGAWALLRYRPRVFLLALPKGFGAFARAIPLIALGSALGIRMCGELAGARFLFLDRPGFQKRIGLWTLRRLHSIRFLGDSIRRAHAHLGLRHAVVFPNGITCPSEPSDPAGRAAARPLRLLFVGALNRSKGVRQLVEAVARCRDDRRPVHLTLLGEWGDAGFDREIRALVDEQRLHGRVRFAGRATGDAKWPFYREAALLVHPTEWDGQPLVILEAMAMGLGVIATRVGAIPDTIRDPENGILLDDNDPRTIAAAIRSLADDPDRLVGVMERNRRAYESTFTTEAYLENVKTWLDALAVDRGNGSARRAERSDAAPNA